MIVKSLRSFVSSCSTHHGEHVAVLVLALVLAVLDLLVPDHVGDGQPEVRPEHVDEDGVPRVPRAEVLPPDHLVHIEENDL